MIKISHSAKDMYLLCPKKYDLHYNKKLRPNWTDSPLFFGNAIDEALNCILLKKKKNLTKEEQTLANLNPFDQFDLYFSKIKICKEEVNLKTDLRASYSNSDYDWDYLDQEDINELNVYIKLHRYSKTNPKELRESIIAIQKEKGWNAIDLIDKGYLNLSSWLSLRRKGHILLKAYIEQLLPKIKVVTDIQKQAFIKGDGVTIVGKVDFEAILDDGKLYTVDNKTSSTRYLDDSVKTSPQLAIYDYATGHNLGAYFVMNKKLKKRIIKACKTCLIETEGKEQSCANKQGKKRCNGELDQIGVRFEVETQDIRGEISKELEEEVLSSYEVVIDLIQSNHFEENRNNCYQYGKKCPYYKLCHENDQTGLVQL